MYLRVKATVGPKGQVVIPKTFRDATGMTPGKQVLIGLSNQKVLIESRQESAVDSLRSLARLGKGVGKLSHKDFDSELEEKFKKFLK
ncbi:MAG TPA: AbrB/MazE/SpoVT family DNA-binding domain-containing protein [archaeon]|nr:AbrB/MazE/SpoVT family DNA-binding domain-containing protein [archaeon]HLD80888.1 AbrB/MazE/SpoVT family DNA-binding domain-containing protein [archaeon]